MNLERRINRQDIVLLWSFFTKNTKINYKRLEVLKARASGYVSKDHYALHTCPSAVMFNGVWHKCKAIRWSMIPWDLSFHKTVALQDLQTLHSFFSFKPTEKYICNFYKAKPFICWIYRWGFGKLWSLYG